MTEYLSSILAKNFMPHGHCFFWMKDVLYLHLVSDVVVALAYYMIPAALVFFVGKRKNVPYPWMFILFGIFILACGTTHVMGAITLWYPYYRLEGYVKAATALASIGTAFALFPLIPKALRLRSPAELERLNRELEKSRQGFRSMVEKNADGLLVVDAEGRIRYGNEAAFRLFPAGGKAGALALGGAYPFSAEEDKEERLLERGGEAVFIEITGSATEWEGQPARLIALRDVTTARKAYLALRESEEKLVQSQKMEAVGRLAGGIAHDFNNLLTAINGYSDLALAALDLPEEHPVRDSLLEVRRAGLRAASLTRQLLAFSRKQIIAPRILDLSESLSTTAKMLARLIGEDIQIVTVFHKGPLPILADPGQLEQIVLNLALNARDAMPKGGTLTLSTDAKDLDGQMVGFTKPPRKGRYALLSVADTGVGMDEAVKRRLFEPFFTTKEVGKGTGLGLSTVYGIVEQGRGYVAVYSEPGLGSTFKVFLPLAAEDLPESPLEAPEEGDLRGTETLLIAEDEEPVRKFMVKVLEGLGYQAVAAESGTDALEKARIWPGPIHALITDVVMAKMGGRELSEKLLLERPEIPVLYVSGYTEDAVVRRGTLEASAHFLSKPFTPQVLARKVRRILDEKASGPAALNLYS